MNAYTFVPRLTLAATLAVGASLLLTSVDAGARERGSNAQRSMPHGDYSRQTERVRTENGRTRSDTWTGANGRSASRDATVVNDRAAGVRSRDVAWQGPNGQTATRNDVTTKTDRGYTRDSTFVGPNGQTTIRNAEVVKDREAGTRSRTATTTLPDGRTRTLDDQLTRTENGYTRDTTITNPQGSTLQRDVVATRDAETGKLVKDVNVDRTPAPRPAAGG